MSKRTAATRRMARDEARAASAGAIEATATTTSAVQAFSFGDPEPVTDGRMLLDMLQCWNNGRWYEPPISRDGLARAFHASPHHSSAIFLKRNLLTASLVPSPYLSRATFAKLAQDYLIFGDAFTSIVRNRLGGPMRLDYLPAKYTRRGLVDDVFYYVPGIARETEYAAGAVVQVLQPDINQEVYGVPEYISALQSALLNESATLFRRRYYLNGSHAGYILYATGEFANGDTDAMREALKKSKGPGNFRNLFIHAPAGKEHGIKVVPIAEVGAKDEFLGIKNATRDDVLAAHRVPPQLLGIVPAQGSSLGKPGEAVDMFFELEIQPLQAVFADMNAAVGVEVFVFRERAVAEAK